MQKDSGAEIDPMRNPTSVMHGGLMESDIGQSLCSGLDPGGMFPKW